MTEVDERHEIESLLTIMDSSRLEGFILLYNDRKIGLGPDLIKILVELAREGLNRDRSPD